MIIMPVKEGENIERALKKFKRKYERTGVLKELRRRQYFTKAPPPPVLHQTFGGKARGDAARYLRRAHVPRRGIIPETSGTTGRIGIRSSPFFVSEEGGAAPERADGAEESDGAESTG